MPAHSKTAANIKAVSVQLCHLKRLEKAWPGEAADRT
jgi:hypothetical protein